MIKLIGIGIIAFLLFILEQKIYNRLWNRNLNVNLSFSRKNIFEGESCSLHEIIENKKRLPLSLLNVKFNTSKYLKFGEASGSKTTDKYYRNDVFMVGGMEKVTRTLEFTAIHRGVYSINSVDLVASDLFLVKQMVENVKVNTTLYVYPKPFTSGELKLSLRQINGEILAKRHLLEDPFEYRGIREYQPFDSMRDINWKASAKTGELKVNQKNFTALKSIRIFMNLEDSGVLKKPECVEASIQIAAGLCNFFLSQGMQVSCYGNAKDLFTGNILSIDANSGTEQMNSIYVALTRLNAENVTSFNNAFKDKVLNDADKAYYTCFISPNAYNDFTDLMEECITKKLDFVWFNSVWESTDPQIPTILAANTRFIHIRK